jgi:hypothetical protein
MKYVNLKDIKLFYMFLISLFEIIYCSNEILLKLKE